MSGREPMLQNNPKKLKQVKLEVDVTPMLCDTEKMGHRFSFYDNIMSKNYPACLVREMDGHEFTVAFIQKHGFNYPLLFRQTSGLGVRVPRQKFTVADVRTCLGSQRVLDALDVATQETYQMTMNEWCKYYDSPEKDKLLHVTSLEFSRTNLEDCFRSPTVVRQIDWVDSVWPAKLKDEHFVPTNDEDDMMYPQVQKYCLMSVKGCYTDFHIASGGASTWYYVVEGVKVFWLIPPTENNLKFYENWVLRGKPGKPFFGDIVEKCSRVWLTAGATSFIPSGWIYAEYTLENCLVVGGNFLHSFSITRQLQIARIENVTHVPQKMKYPLFTEMQWYALAKYVLVLLGRNHLDDYHNSSLTPTSHIHLTIQELHGLRDIVNYLHNLQSHSKKVPLLIKDPIALMKDVRSVVELHRNDGPHLAVSGRYVLTLFDDVEVLSTSSQQQPVTSHKFIANEPSYGQPGTLTCARGQETSGVPCRRRTRCNSCVACCSDDCMHCVYCTDMMKFSGAGKSKQSCIKRQCLQPLLPVTATCAICGLDGCGRLSPVPAHKLATKTRSSIVECCKCHELVHPRCYLKSYPGMHGIYKDELPNLWECPGCCAAANKFENKVDRDRDRTSNE